MLKINSTIKAALVIFGICLLSTACMRDNMGSPDDTSPRPITFDPVIHQEHQGH